MCVVKALRIFLMKQRLVDLAGKHTILVCVWVKWRRILITEASKTTFSNFGVVLSNWFLQSIGCAMPLSHLGNYEPADGLLLCVFYPNIPYSVVERFLLQLFELYTQGLEKQSQIAFTDYLRPIQAKTLLYSALFCCCFCC